MEIKALIVDDEKNAREYMETAVKKNIPEIEMLYSTSDLTEAQLLVNLHAPHLVFLDIEMPGQTGFDFLRSQKEKKFDVIFTTAFSKYAIQAIRFSAIDFLLKPVQPDELRDAFQRFLSQPKEMERRKKLYDHLFENLDAKSETSFKLSLSKGNRHYFISPHDIYHCQGDNNYTKLYLKDHTEFVIAKTLKELDEMLHEFGFIRMHKSSLVNKAHVRLLRNDAIAVLENNVEVEISRRRLQEVKNRIKMPLT